MPGTDAIDEFRQWYLEHPDATEFEVAKEIWRLSVKLSGRYQPWKGCDKCGKQHFPTVMLHDRLWLSIARKETVLCPDCVEQMLGRPIVFGDLKPCGATDTLHYGARMAVNSGIQCPIV